MSVFHERAPHANVFFSSFATKEGRFYVRVAFHERAPHAYDFFSSFATQEGRFYERVAFHARAPHEYVFCLSFATMEGQLYECVVFFLSSELRTGTILASECFRRWNCAGVTFGISPDVLTGGIMGHATIAHSQHGRCGPSGQVPRLRGPISRSAPHWPARTAIECTA